MDFISTIGPYESGPGRISETGSPPAADLLRRSPVINRLDWDLFRQGYGWKNIIEYAPVMVNVAVSPMVNIPEGFSFVS